MISTSISKVHIGTMTSPNITLEAAHPDNDDVISCRDMSTAGNNEGESSDVDISTLAELVKHALVVYHCHDPTAVDMARVHRILHRILNEEVLNHWIH
jgi:hypothetical protein